MLWAHLEFFLQTEDRKSILLIPGTNTLLTFDAFLFYMTLNEYIWGLDWALGLFLDISRYNHAFFMLFMLFMDILKTKQRRDYLINQ